MMIESYGREIQELRQQADLSLRELARLAGLSPASLSAIEKSTSSPTLATLQKILKALGTDFATFFARHPASDHQPVFLPGQMKAVEDAHRRYTLLLPRREDIKLEMVHEDLQPGEQAAEWETHDFDLAGTVLQGGPLRLEFQTGQSWDVPDHGAYYIPAGQTHRAFNAGAGTLKQITVCHPPRY
jgi:transcriptional regulator with XRE-family HTH domain